METGTVVLALCGLLWAPSLAEAANATLQRPPNLVVLLMDDVSPWGWGNGGGARGLEGLQDAQLVELPATGSEGGLASGLDKCRHLVASRHT